MRALSWVSSYPRSGCDWIRVLVTSYVLDLPAPDVTTDGLHQVAPDLTELFDYGRAAPLGDDHAWLVKTHFHPAVQVLRQYRESTGKATYLVRNPRDVITSHVRRERLGGDDRRWAAMRMIEQVAPTGEPVRGLNTWARHVLDWSSPERVQRYFPDVEDVCVLRFEDVRADPAAALSTIIKYLDTAGAVDPGRVRRTIDRSALQDILAAAGTLPPDGLSTFRDVEPAPPPTPIEVDKAELSLTDLGEDVEAAYRKRMNEDEEFAMAARKFGYEIAG